MAREIVRKDGFGTSGLAKGLHATVIRNGMFNGVYFGFYYNMKHLLPQEVYIPLLTEIVDLSDKHTIW